MQFFNEERMRCVRHLAGDRYSTNAAPKKTYINLIGLFVNIVGRQLITQNPRFMLSTFDASQRPVVTAAEAWLNQELVRTNFAEVMKRIVFDALFQIGIPKVCLATPADAETMAWGVNAGEPFISHVDPEDFLYDYRARYFDEVRFIGHRYAMPLEVAMDNPRFDKKARERLYARSQIAYDNSTGSERIGQIGRGSNYGHDVDLCDMVELYEFYCPQERAVKTFTEADLSGPGSAWEGENPIPLGVQRWIGPDRGPYPVLGFMTLPGNIHPLGPILHLVNLHEGINEGYRKLMRQSARFKKNSVCDANDPSDGKALNDAYDGQTVPLRNPTAVVEITQGGADPRLFQWVLQNMKDFMKMAGNLETMGGLAAQAGTLGQEEILAQQSSGQVASMYDSTAACACKCADSMLWYAWNHPTQKMNAQYSHPELRKPIARTVYPWNHPDPGVLRRTGPKPDIKIDLHSMKRSTPQQHVKDMLGVITQIFVPLAQVFMQQGKTLNIDKVMEIISKRTDLPELSEIFDTRPPMPSGENSPKDGPAPPREQTVRRFASSGSGREQDMEMNNAVAAMASESN